MTSEPRIERERKFVPDILPWLVGAAALVGYLATLNRWVSLANVGQVVQVAGWDWRPNLFGPVQFLATYPFRWLPEAWLPAALNLFAAVCGALTLGLLARSVALLPHDRTPQQRKLERNEFSLLSIRAAWIPPVLAALVCGLQLSFWENAVNATGEMLNLLIFAYVVRCLLEYRLAGRQSWLSRAAFFFGAGVANNWGMIGFFPLFLVALIWLRQVAFFNTQFLIRMALYGLAGVSLFLLLPLIQAVSAEPHVDFWPALRAVLVADKNIVLMLFRQFYYSNRDVALLLALTSLLPLLVMSIRWRTSSGDSSPLGMNLANAMFHITHILILLVCVWMFFDPRFSPRQAVRLLGANIPLLSLYYLSALVVGYYSGYLLLIFGAKPPHGRSLVFFVERLAHRFIPKFIWVLLGLAPLALFFKNFPTIRAGNQPTAAQYGSLTAPSLPAQGAVVLSDDRVRAFLLQAALAGRTNNAPYALLSTDAFQYEEYQRHLRRRYPQFFPEHVLPPTTNPVVDSRTILQVLSTIAQSNALCYLHPSFGYYFEQFYLEPHGLAYHLKFYPPGQISPPPLDESQIEENEAFWNRIDATVLAPLIKLSGEAAKAQPGGVLGRFMDFAYLKREADPQAAFMGAYYSRALDYWGVQLQRRGRLPEAARCFQRAVELYPDNVVAQINLQYNTNLQAGQKSTVKLSKSIEDQFGKYRSWDQIINFDGPFDEPSFCYELGRTFVGAGLYRQAAHQFERVIELAPDNLEARLWMAQLYGLWRMPDQTLKLAAEIRSRPELMALARTNETDLVALEAAAHFSQTNHQAARQTIQSALERHPGDTNLLATAMRVYAAYGQYTNALAAVEILLRSAPDDVNCLVNKGYFCMQLEAFTDAIPALTRALSLQTNNYQARFNRAIAHIRTDNLDAALADYLELNKVFPTAFQVYYGLGEIAYRRNDTNAAIIYYQNYLSNSVPNSAESKAVSARLEELKAGAR